MISAGASLAAFRGYFPAMPATKRGPLRTLAFAAVLAVVLGTLVATVSVLLEPRQAENIRREQEAVLQSLIACEPELAALLEDESAGAALQARLVDLDSGCYVRGADPLCYDVSAAAGDPAQRLTLRPAQDIASIGHRPNRMPIYEVRRDGELALLVLPVYGLGYQSRLEGFLSLAGDLNTVSSLVFYAHGETPGMGDRIGEPTWQAQWRDKKLRDEAGALRIGVALRPGEPASPYTIDAMSGATRTGQGVTKLLRFWLGDLGYEPLLRSIRAGDACVEP